MGGKQLMGLVTRGVVLLMLKLGVLEGSSHFELLKFVISFHVYNLILCIYIMYFIKGIYRVDN